MTIKVMLAGCRTYSFIAGYIFDELRGIDAQQNKKNICHIV